jgi:type IV pilus assembly protein PilA
VTPFQPSPAFPPPPKKSFPTWAIVLLVTGGLVLVIGSILAVLAIYGMRKYLANAKMAEARNSLGQIAKDAAVAYEKEDPATPGKRRLCPSASRPVPASIAAISAKKYQSSPSDWEVDKATNAGFYCLEFSLDSPQYYQYGYEAHGTSTPGSGFTATAHGDLNGDGITSEFSVMGQIDSTGNLVIAPNLLEKNPEE